MSYIDDPDFNRPPDPFDWGPVIYSTLFVVAVLVFLKIIGV